MKETKENERKRKKKNSPKWKTKAITTKEITETKLNMLKIPTENKTKWSFGNGVWYEEFYDGFGLADWKKKGLINVPKINPLNRLR